MRQEYNNSVIIALGGNAISPKGEAGTIQQQFAHTRRSLKAVMHFVRKKYKICITHGNGPQVGDELLRNELAADQIPPLPLGVLVANTQGAIGYMIQQSLQNALYAEASEREVVTFISQMKVDRNDPAIQNPTKFVGRRYTAEQARKLSLEQGWNIKEQDPGEWRRVVPSPEPLYIFNGKSIKHLYDFGTIMIAGGGGGIPAYNEPDGRLEGLDGVIDKDKTAALLGRIIRAREMFIITDVDNIFTNYGKPEARPIRTATASQIKAYLDEGHFQSGTMAPKIRAALYFLRHHGEKVVITSIARVEEALAGEAGSVLIND
ncbi:MAG: carbamate kinase [FCB group bacterium]|nr:carbamate kinase [FCB group bacterium]